MDGETIIYLRSGLLKEQELRLLVVVHVLRKLVSVHLWVYPVLAMYQPPLLLLRTQVV
jgi:hypothetical protein